MFKFDVQISAPKIFLVASLFIVGCALEPMEPGEEASYVNGFCSSQAYRLPSPEEIVVSDSITTTYSECMIDHGYLDKAIID
jgi:hypothetical protein